MSLPNRNVSNPVPNAAIGPQTKPTPQAAAATQRREELIQREAPAAYAKDRLLLIDDDNELCELLAQYLGTLDFEVHAVQDGEAGVNQALSGQHDIIILDVMLPGIDGLEALRRIRTRSSVPVLMLTARGDDDNRIAGLELGADDYLAKPFNPRELVARLRAILRRVENLAHAAPGRQSNGRLAVDDVEIDPAARQVWREGAPVYLTGAEFDLLEILLRSAGSVVHRDELFRSVLDREPLPMDRSIDMHVSHLRKKLGRERDGAERIKSIRGVGYIYTYGTISQ